MRRLKQAGLGPPRIGERSALEAEHLGFEQGFGDRRAVDVDERTVRTGTRSMNQSSQEPLARARLALDEHRGQAASILLPLQEARDPLADRLDPGAFT